MIEFKDWPRIPTGAPHPIHGEHRQREDGKWIKYHKGHMVTRPYLKYSTSKWEQSIIDVYEILFDYLKHRPVKLLEIGVYFGESMHYFHDFFTHPDTQIIGLDGTSYEAGGWGCDFDPDALSKVTIEISDQRDRPAMKAIAKKYGPFDIVIDDGNHSADACQASFEDYWPAVKDGGFYIIEDTPPEKIGAELLNEVVTTRQGKGYTTFRGTKGFGPEAGEHGLTVLKKTQNLITGLDEDLLA